MFGNDEILEFAVGLQKDPSWDRLMATMPADVRRKLGKGASGGFDDMYTQGKAMFTRLGNFAMGALGVGGAAGMAMRVKSVAEIEEMTARLARSAGLTEKQERELADAVMHTSQEYGASREEQLAALQSIQDKYAIVGKMAEDGGLKEFTKIAALTSDAFGMSEESTMNFMGSLLKAGVAGDELVDTMAMLEQAANMGSIGYKEFGNVMPELTSEAAQFGEGGVNNVMDVAAALETLTAKIQDPARAATYLRGTFSKLKDEDVKNRMMEELGVSTQDANREMRDLSDIITDIQDAMEGRAGGEQAAILKRIFGSEEAVSTISELLRSGGTFKAILDLQIGESTEGFMKNLEEANNDTASNMDKLKAKFTGLIDEVLLTEESMEGLSIGMDYLGATMEGAIQGMRAGADSQMELVGLTKEMLFDVQESLENIFNFGNMKLGGDKDYFEFDVFKSARRGGVEHEGLSNEKKIEFLSRIVGIEGAANVFRAATSEPEEPEYQGFRGKESTRFKKEGQQWVTLSQESIDAIGERVEKGAEAGSEKGTKKAKTNVTIVGPTLTGPPADNTVMDPGQG